MCIKYILQYTPFFYTKNENSTIYHMNSNYIEDINIEISQIEHELKKERENIDKQLPLHDWIVLEELHQKIIRIEAKLITLRYKRHLFEK